MESLHPESERLLEVLIPRIPMLRRYVARRIPKRLGHIILVDDVLQEVWISAGRGFATFRADAPEAIEHWLKKIVESRLIDAVRRVKRLKRDRDREVDCRFSRWTDSTSALYSRVVDSEKTPSKVVGEMEREHAAQIALLQLGDARREAMELRYIRGLTPPEVAQRMERSLPAVNDLLFRGRRDLRTILGSASKYYSDVDSAEELEV